MAKQTYKNDAGQSITIEAEDGSPPPTDAELNALYDQHSKRERITAAATEGAKARSDAELEANQQYLAGNKMAAGGAEALVSKHPTARAIIGPAMEMAYGGLLGEPLLRAAASQVPGSVGTMARAAVANPRLTGAAMLGVPKLMQGDIPGAIYGAGLGLLLGARGQKAEALGEAAKLGLPAAEAAVPAAEAAIPAAARGVSTSGALPNVIPFPQTVRAMMGGAAPASSTVGPQTVAAMASEAAPATGAFTKTIEPLTPESILSRIAMLKSGGLSQGQIIASLKETHGLVASQAKKVLEMAERIME